MAPLNKDTLRPIKPNFVFLYIDCREAALYSEALSFIGYLEGSLLEVPQLVSNQNVYM